MTKKWIFIIVRHPACRYSPECFGNYENRSDQVRGKVYRVQGGRLLGMNQQPTFTYRSGGRGRRIRIWFRTCVRRERIYLMRRQRRRCPKVSGQMRPKTTNQEAYGVRRTLGGRFPFSLTLPNHWGSKRKKLPPVITPVITLGICWHFPGTSSKGNGRYP